MADNDKAAESSDPTDPPAEPVYSFDGFNQQFCFKVALTPATAATTPPTAPGRKGAA